MRQEWWKPCSKFRESLLKCFITYRVTTRCSIEWQTPFALPSSATCICYNKQLKRRMRFGDFWRHKGTEGRVIKTIFLFSLRNIQRHFHWETYHTMSTKREKEKKDIFFLSIYDNLQALPTCPSPDSTKSIQSGLSCYPFLFIFC